MDSRELYWHMRTSVSAGGHGWGAAGNRSDEEYANAHDRDHAGQTEVGLTHDHQDDKP